MIGPFAKETHWKQTVFYIDTFIPVTKGDEISGSFAVKKAKKNPRELDVKISFHLQSEKKKSFSKIQFYKIT